MHYLHWRNHLLEKIKDIVFKLVLSVAAAALLIAACEVVLRVVQKPPHVRISSVHWNDISIPESTRAQSGAYKRYPWAAEYYAEFRKGHFGRPDYHGGMFYVPFVLWKQGPYISKYINYDNDGFRLTVNPHKLHCSQHRLVYGFGGSTMGGDGLLRDQDTLPSQLSKILNEAYPNACIEVSNFGVSGYNQGNEFVLFSEIMGSKPTPDVAFFYDGFNDVFHQVLSGTPHMAYTSFLIMNKLWQGQQQKFLKPMLRGLAYKLRLAQLFMKPEETDFPLVDNDGDVKVRAEGVGTTYAEHLKVLDQMSKGSGCDVLVFLQPTLFFKAQRADGEKELLDKTKKFLPFAEKSLQVTYDSIKDHLKDKPYRNRLIDMTDAINTNEWVYIDAVHVNPLGNELAAKRIAAEIIRRNALKL